MQACETVRQEASALWASYTDKRLKYAGSGRAIGIYVRARTLKNSSTSAWHCLVGFRAGQTELIFAGFLNPGPRTTRNTPARAWRRVVNYLCACRVLALLDA